MRKTINYTVTGILLVLIVIAWKIGLEFLTFLMTIAFIVVSFAWSPATCIWLIGTGAGRNYARVDDPEEAKTRTRFFVKVWMAILVAWLILAIPSVSSLMNRWVPGIPLALGWKGTLWVCGWTFLGAGLGRFSPLQQLLDRIRPKA